MSIPFDPSMLIFSMRYAMGRTSMAPSMVSEWIKFYWSELEPHTRALILRELGEALDLSDRNPQYLGDACDFATWRCLYDWASARDGYLGPVQSEGPALTGPLLQLERTGRDVWEASSGPEGDDTWSVTVRSISPYRAKLKVQVHGKIVTRFEVEVAFMEDLLEEATLLARIILRGVLPHEA